MSYRYLGSRGSGAPSWFFQRVTGIVLAIVMIFHFFLMHTDPASGHTYQAVLDRLSHPFWKMFDLAFVILGLYHGVNGTIGIFRDFEMKPWLRMGIYGFLVVLAVYFGVLGFTTILKF